MAIEADYSEISIRVPSDVAALLGNTYEERSERVSRAVVAELLLEASETGGKSGISDGRAGSILGVDRGEIIDLMKRWHIPSLVMTEDELRSDLELLEKIRPTNP